MSDPPPADLPSRARALALELHAGQARKGSGISYVDGHLDPVAALVRGAGGTDAQIAAAYLHDAAEDAGGNATLERIAAEVDPHVAELVAALSDSLVDTTSDITKVPWLERKPGYVEKLAGEPDEVLEVSVADKLHNARAIVQDLEDPRVGVQVFDRFTGGRDGTLGYYHSLATIFAGHSVPIAGQLNVAVERMHRLAGADERRPLQDRL